MFLVIAVTAASLVLLLGGIKQAYAYNLILEASEQTTVQIAVLHELEKQKQKKADREHGSRVEYIEPASGE